MDSKDQKYQSAVDMVTKELAEKNCAYLLNLPYLSEFNKDGISVGVWHHAYGDEEHHIVVKAERKVLIIFWRNYLNGIIIKNQSQIITMPPETMGNYD